MKTLIALLLIVLTVGCSNTGDYVDIRRPDSGKYVYNGTRTYNVDVVQSHGHDYLVASNSDGISIIHAEHCECKTSTVGKP